MMGIDVDRVIAVTFFIGSALAGAAGVMFGLVFGQIYHYMGFIAGLKGFTAAVIGGIGSIPGAMVGGLHRRPRRVVRDRLPAAGLDLPEPVRLRAADPDDPHPAERPVGTRRDPEGLMATEPPRAGPPRIGVDEWVASVEGKRERYSGLSGSVQPGVGAAAAVAGVLRASRCRPPSSRSSRPRGTSSATD